LNHEGTKDTKADSKQDLTPNLDFVIFVPLWLKCFLRALGASA